MPQRVNDASHLAFSFMPKWMFLGKMDFLVVWHEKAHITYPISTTSTAYSAVKLRRSNRIELSLVDL